VPAEEEEEDFFGSPPSGQLSRLVIGKSREAPTHPPLIRTSAEEPAKEKTLYERFTGLFSGGNKTRRYKRYLHRSRKANRSHK
jgi:hypothetical protein